MCIKLAKVRPSVRRSLLFLAGFLTTRVVSAGLSEDYLQKEIRHAGSRGEVRITLVFSRALESRIPLLTEKTRQALDLAPRRLGVSFRDDFWIFFDARPDTHNGLATVVPNDRIFIQTEAPFFDESIGYGSDYLAETILHELGHMAPLQQRGGIFSLLSYLFGNSSRPVGLWPRWIHEGLAVWTEEAIGGRPASGAIDVALRKYAEHVRRTDTAPFSDADLDGRPQVREVEEGSLPYHFGYLLIDAWAKRHGGATPMASFVEGSSRTLGAAFRSTFRSEGTNLDRLFEEESERWAKTPLPSAQVTHEESKTLVAEAATLLGPFANDAGLSWVEMNSAGDRIELVKRLPGASNERATWTSRYLTPQQAFSWADGGWVVLVRQYEANLSLPARRVVARYDREGQRVCELRTPARLREIDVRYGTLAWVRSQEDGTQILERARFETPCKLGATTEIARGERPFERLSGPRIERNGEVSYSRTRGDNLTNEVAELRGERVRDPRGHPLALPQPLASSFCPQHGAYTCFVAQSFSREHWGPVLASWRDGRWKARALPLATGAERSAWLEGEGKLAVNERLWEKDRLVLVPLTAFDGAEFPLEAEKIKPAPAPVAAASSETEAYGAAASLWPRFWTPVAAVIPGGFLLMGQTFYEDLTRSWAGQTSVGYDSFVQKPFAITSLARKRLDWGWLSQAGVSLNYLPVFNYLAASGDSPSQDRWGGSFYVHFARLLPRDWILTVTPQIEYLGSAKAVRVEGFHALIPSVDAVLRSAYGLSPASTSKRGDLTHAGIYARTSVGTYKAPFTVQELNLSFPLPRSAAQLTAQYANSSPSNFPAIYYEWGGLPEIATSSTGFLSRGFAPRAAAGRTVFRGAAEWQFTLAKPRTAFSWNRARLDTIESRWIAETVSFTSFTFLPGAVPFYQAGRQYFTSVGTVLDFWGSGLHYINFTAGLGVFRGFGPFGETRVALTLRSWLDI